MAAIDDLTAQILGQNLTSKWTGEGYGGAEANAKAMAKLLADAGITDIKQFGKVPKYAPVSDYANTTKDYYKGRPVEYTEDGQPYVNLGDTGGEGPTIERITPKQVEKVRGQYDYGAEGGARFVPLDESKVVKKDGKELLNLGTTFGNKETGQAINKGTGRWNDQGGDDLFSGTGEGDGNTAFRVQFRDDGTPVFYTTKGSSNDLFNILSDNPLLNIAANVAATAFLGPLGAGALQLAQGKDIGDAAKATLLAYAGKELTSGLGGGGDASSLAPSDTGGLIGGSESVFDPTFGGELSPVIGGGAESVFDPTFGGTLSDVGSGATPIALPTSGYYNEITGEFVPDVNGPLQGPLTDASGTNIDSMDGYFYDKTTDTWVAPDGQVYSPTTGQPVTTEPTPTETPKSSKFPLSVSDTIRLAGIGTALAGGAKAISDSGSGSGGYPIVPIPSDWTSPIKPTGVAEFTPLAPIDFGNKEMLRGTQWEQLLSPDYGKAPAMPNVPTNPSNMSFDQLMGVLGNTRTSMPTQNVSINDVIAGIQSQYGQTPTGSMG